MEKTKTLDESIKEQINSDLYPDSSITMCSCGKPLYASKERKDAYCMICDVKRLGDIENRFYRWTYLSDQQQEDIIWLISRLKGVYSG